VWGMLTFTMGRGKEHARTRKGSLQGRWPTFEVFAAGTEKWRAPMATPDLQMSFRGSGG